MNKPVVLERQERCAQLAARSPWGGEGRGMSSSAELPRGVYLHLGPKPLDSLGLLWIWSQSHLMTHLKDSHLNTDSDNCLTMRSKTQVRYDSRKGSILIETARASRVGGCSHRVSGHQSPATDLMSSRGGAPLLFPITAVPQNTTMGPRLQGIHKGMPWVTQCPWCPLQISDFRICFFSGCHIAHLKHEERGRVMCSHDWSIYYSRDCVTM